MTSSRVAAVHKQERPMTDLKTNTSLSSTQSPQSFGQRKLRVIVVGPNGGGVRKTKTSLAIGSVATAAGSKVLYVCADRGIGSLSASLKEGGHNHVEMLPDEETSNYSETLLAIAKQVGADVIIIDLGANEMLNSKSRRTIRAAMRQLNALGHQTFTVISLVHGKVGLDDDASNFARQMSRDGEILLAFHGVDEGGDFSQFQELRGDYTSVDVPNDQPAILAMITSAGVTPFDWCSVPTPGFEMAAALTAHNLCELARQPGMADLVNGLSAIPVLSDLAKKRPTQTYSNLTRRWQVSDECLSAEVPEHTLGLALLRLDSRSTDAEVLDAARAFMAASKTAREARVSAQSTY